MATYPVQIEVTDMAEYQVGEEEVYETMHLDFDRFCNRLVNLIESQDWIGDGPKLKLERDGGRESDRLVTKQNLSGTFVDREGTDQSTLHSLINFTLVDECVDSSTLYG